MAIPKEVADVLVEGLGVGGVEAMLQRVLVARLTAGPSATTMHAATRFASDRRGFAGRAGPRLGATAGAILQTHEVSDMAHGVLPFRATASVLGSPRSRSGLAVG